MKRGSDDRDAAPASIIRTAWPLPPAR